MFLKIAGGQDGYLNKPKVVDELKAARLSAARALGDGLSTVEVGFNYSERSKALARRGSRSAI